jgi:hypothetical protein
MILYWDKSITTDITVDFNRHDTVPFGRGNITARAIDRGFLLTHNLPKSDAEKITKYKQLGHGNKKKYGSLTAYIFL